MTSDDMAARATDAELAEMGAPSPDAAERLAALFHATYEALAPSRSYATRPASAVPWTEVPEPNRSLMIAVAGRVLVEWPTIAASPDVDAGGTGLDVYESAARVAVEVFYPKATKHQAEYIRQRAASPAFRAAIDAARAPLLAQLGEAGESMYDYQHAATRADEQRDQARADRDVAEREMERYRQEALDLVAELAEAIRERDEARAKTEGGESGVQFGHQLADGEWRWEPRGINYATHLRKWWAGPPERIPRTFGQVEPVTDGEAAP